MGDEEREYLIFKEPRDNERHHQPVDEYFWEEQPKQVATHFSIGNSIFHLSLELLTKFWKTSPKVA